MSASNRIFRRWQTDTTYLSCVAFTPDGDRVVSSGRYAVIFIHNVVSGKLEHVLKGHNDCVWNLAITKDSQRIISVSSDRTTRVWDTNSGKELNKFDNERSSCLALTPDDKFFLTTGGPWNIYVRRLDDGAQVRELTGHVASIYEIAVSPDGLYVVSGSRDSTACVWLLTDEVLKKHTIEHPRCVFSVAVTPDSQRFFTGCRDGVVRLFQMVTGTLVHTCQVHLAYPMYLAVSPNGRCMVSTLGETFGCAYVWNLDDDNFKTKQILRLSMFGGQRVCFRANSKQIANVGSSGMVYIVSVCPWSDRDHQLFGPGFKALVFLLMCIKEKLDTLSQNKEGRASLPRLPMAVWLQVFGILHLIT